MFTRSIVIQRRVEDLQLGVRSYQKKLNLTKPDTYKPDLKRMEAYTAYSNPRGFIYQNKDKKNTLMRIDELHKFSDGRSSRIKRILKDGQEYIKIVMEEIWLHVQQMLKVFDIGIKDKKAKLFTECERFTSTDGESIESYYHCFSKLMNDFKRSKHFPEKIASNFEFLNNLQPEWRRHVTIVHQTKDFHEVVYTHLYDFLKYNQAENFRNQNGYNAVQNVENQVVQNPGVQNVRNLNGLIVVPGIANPNANPNGNGNVIAARVEGNDNRNNENQIRCYNYRGLGHLARNYTVIPRKRDAAYLQTQLLIAQKEEAWIPLQAEEFDFIAVVGYLDKIKEVNAKCILMANLQQVLTSGTHIDKAPIYGLDGSVEVHEYDKCYNNEIFNMFTQEEQYTELLEPILEQHQVQQNDNNVISVVLSVEQSGGTIEKNHATVEETYAYFESLYNNLVIEVEKVNMVNRKMKETNADLTTELARYKNQEKCVTPPN
ncbi:hypothetical protein Tco_0174253 [Tanacetum coccineum]